MMRWSSPFKAQLEQKLCRSRCQPRSTFHFDPPTASRNALAAVCTFSGWFSVLQNVTPPPGCSRNYSAMTSRNAGVIGTVRKVISLERSRFFSRKVIVPASKSKSSTRERRISERRAPVNAARQNIA